MTTKFDKLKAAYMLSNPEEALTKMPNFISMENAKLNGEKKTFIFTLKIFIGSQIKNLGCKKELKESQTIIQKIPEFENKTFLIKNEKQKEPIKQFIESNENWSNYAVIDNDVLFISKKSPELIILFEKTQFLGFEVEEIPYFAFNYNKGEDNCTTYDNIYLCHKNAVNGDENPAFKVMEFDFDDNFVVNTKNIKDLPSWQILEQYKKLCPFDENQDVLYYFVSNIPFDEMNDVEKDLFEGFGIKENERYANDEFLGDIYLAKVPKGENDDQDEGETNHDKAVRKNYDNFMNLCAALYNIHGRIPITIREKSSRDDKAEYIFMKIIRPISSKYQITINAKDGSQQSIKTILDRLRNSEFRVYAITINPKKEGEYYVFCESRMMQLNVKTRLFHEFKLEQSKFLPN